MNRSRNSRKLTWLGLCRGECGSESTPCEHERISEVGRGGSTGRTGTEQCTFGEALGKLHTPKCLAPMPSPSLSGGMDASTPLWRAPLRKAFLIYSTLPFVITPTVFTFPGLMFSCCSILSSPFQAHFSAHQASALGFSPSCGSATPFMATPPSWVTSAGRLVQRLPSPFQDPNAVKSTSLKDSSWEYHNVN